MAFQNTLISLGQNDLTGIAYYVTADASPTPWIIHFVHSPGNWGFWNKNNWDVAVTQDKSLHRAVITLSPDAEDEIDVLQSGGQFGLGLYFDGDGPKLLYVQMAT